MNILKHIKVAGTLLALGAGMLAASQASAQTVTDIIKRGSVKIGVLIGAPPYGSVDSQGNAIGYDADVIALIGKYLGVKVEMVQLTPPARIPPRSRRAARSTSSRAAHAWRRMPTQRRRLDPRHPSSIADAHSHVSGAGHATARRPVRRRIATG